ncbi:von Willebrand factor A domain-containing protein 7-like [Candoia aspera]|uniref:von Willebrand factor A domain-containing protein 7-like n=1 Tax=Candoia aspera TaxID=51853 RepID=UPI002FD87773
MLLSLLVCAGIVSGFHPNHESGGISPSDYTDADITEMGALRALAWYMERNPLPGRPTMAPGVLENMMPLNATGLFKAYFQADVSPSRFLSALQEIVNENNKVETRHSQDSSYFFYCEHISKSIKQLQVLSNSMLSSLRGEVNSTALEAARCSAGKALHILQKFYSNTNWVEMQNLNPYEHLLNSRSPVFPTAPLSKKTCRDCERKPSGQLLCDRNLLVNDVLTSGYKISRSCRMKRQGKCGHGGNTDVTQYFSPTGGINKETSNPKFSPHYLLHQKAAELAIEATKSFFVGDGFGLLNKVGDGTFRKFFNLDGYSLALVIDTTGSMKSDIDQVKINTIRLLRNYSGSPDAPFNYVLVPFNDPDVGPIVKTRSVDDLESAIANLTAAGGGDCPEMAMTGVKLALLESLPRSKIFVFTDAAAKDRHLKDEVKILIDSSQSVVSYILTGVCTRRRPRSPAERESKTYTNIYEEVAAYSGGLYLPTTKRLISQVLGLMEMFLKAASVKLVDSRVYASQFSIPVDDTLKDLTISVKALSPFSMNVLQPSGSPLGSLNMLINTNKHKIVMMSPIPERGLWTVTMFPINNYEILVEGKSLLDFSYQIMEKQNGYVVPIQGRPVKGLTYTISLKLMADTAGIKVLHLVPISEQGTPLESIHVNQTFDALGNPLVVVPASFHLPRTLLKVEGLSPGNFPFQRISRDSISTESLQIEPLPEQNDTLAPGESLEVSVLVINSGAATTFVFKVWDDLNFLKSYAPTSGFLNTGKNITLTATFVAPVVSGSFASSIATFTAKSGSTQNYLKLPINVIPEAALEIDEIPPEHKLKEFYMPCKGKIQEEPDCSHHTWHMSFVATDANSAVTVRINANPSGLSCTPERGDNKNVICDFRSDCCTPYAEVLISDENGNSSTFTVDYRNSRPAPA